MRILEFAKNIWTGHQPVETLIGDKTNEDISEWSILENHASQALNQAWRRKYANPNLSDEVCFWEYFRQMDLIKVKCGYDNNYSGQVDYSLREQRIIAVAEQLYLGTSQDEEPAY